MRTKSIAKICAYISAGSLFVACGTTPAAMPTVFRSTATPEPQRSECIPSTINLAIPAGLSVPTPELKQMPPLGWEMIAQSPESISKFLNSFVVRGNEVWISYGSDNGSKLVKYDISTGRWKFYNPTGSYNLGMTDLFITRDGGLWGTYHSGIANTNEKTSLISRYNKSSDQFDFLIDKQKILQYPTELRSRIVEDGDGSLWMFIKDTDKSELISLYSFNPSILEGEKHPLHLNTYLGSVTIGPGGNIWTADLLEGKLLRYDPATREIRLFDSLSDSSSDIPQFKLNDEIREGGYPYYDGSGRLWLGNQGWLDVSDPDHLIWYKLIPSPVFLGYFEGPWPGYALTPIVYSIYRSTNGWIWFTTNIGIVRLKILKGYEQGEWCLITNGHSPVVEDNEHNLWIIVFNKLYKYSSKN